MADFQAIGGVSATLQTLLQDRMDFPIDLLPSGQSVMVTVDAPPLYEPDEGVTPAEVPQVNLFLYRVAENAFLKNQELPGNGGGAYGVPPLSLELFYLLTAYGRSSEGQDIGDSKLAHYLLGSAMRVFHEFPVITESLVRHAAPVIGDPVLDTRLFGEFEQLRLCPHSISLEDLTKVWTSLAQPYRLSAAYVVSATQIESRRPRRFPRPVGEPPAAGPRITAVTLPRSEIKEVRAIRGGTEHPYPYARTGDKLVLLGRGFVGMSIGVELSSIHIPVRPVSATRIEVDVPDGVLPPPDGSPIAPEQMLQPGIHGVRVQIGVEALPQVAFDSNQAVFMLVPSITTAVAIDPPTSDPRLLHVQGSRLWHERLPAQTVIGRSVIPASRYTLASSTQIDVPVPDALPRWPAACLLGDNAAAFSGTPGSTELDIQIGGGGFQTLSLAPMADLETAARLLGAAIRAETDAGAGYTNARVALVRDATHAHLVIIPGGLRAPIAVQEHGGTVATDLSLTAAAGAVTHAAYLSGELAPFPTLTAGSPRLRVTIDTVVRTVTLPVRPSTIADAATVLQAAIRNAAAGDPNFAVTYVAVLGSQLLILPGNGFPMKIEDIAGVDTTSARELQLRGDYLIRVRVNGAESLDDAVITLP